MNISLLSGAHSNRSKPLPVQAATKPAGADVDVFAREIVRLSEELQAARQQIEVLRAETAGIREQLQQAQAALQVAQAEVGTARTAAASQQAKADGLEARLAAQTSSQTQRTEDLLGQFEQILTRLAAERATPVDLRPALAEIPGLRNKIDHLINQLKPAPVPPAVEPPSYVMEVVSRDVNGRAQALRLKPAKG